MNPPPPMPHDCGRTTLSPNTIEAAASIALPPRSRSERPMADAIGDSLATTPPAPRAPARYIDPSLAAAPEATSREQSAPAVALHRRTFIAPVYGAGSGRAR